MSYRITINDDMDLEKIAHCGQCFRAGDIGGGLYRFVTGRNVLYLKAECEYYEASCTPEEWANVWNSYFDLDRCYARVRASIRDPWLLKASEEGTGIRVLRQEPFEMLITFLISQRKSIPAIRRAVESLCTLLGDPVATAYETLHLFPSPAAILNAGEAALGGCGLGYRVPYVLDAARKVVSGELDPEALRAADTGDVITALLGVHGVGIKVAGCVALFAYGRSESVPVDTWIAKLIAEKYNGNDPFRQYGENAGLLQQYAFFCARGKKVFD